MTGIALRFILAITLFPATPTTQAKPPLAFDVVSIKPSDPAAADFEMGLSPGKFYARNQSLLDLIKFGYGLDMGSDRQIFGGPKWLASTKFDIDAKEDEQTVAALKAMGPQDSAVQIRRMVVDFLSERFGLRLHRESRIMPVFALTQAGGGSKMTIVPDRAPPVAHDWSGIRQRGAGDIEGHNLTMAIFLSVVARQPGFGGRVVIDRTALPGQYNFTLKWTPESGPGAADRASSESAAPAFVTALREQLGLQVESTRAPVEIIVVDSAVLPTSN